LFGVARKWDLAFIANAIGELRLRLVWTIQVLTSSKQSNADNLVEVDSPLGSTNPSNNNELMSSANDLTPFDGRQQVMISLT
jgi:hypothetical protein